MYQIEFSRKPKSPFRLDLTAWALRRLPTNIIDRFQNGEYRRSIVIENEFVEIKVSQRDPSEGGSLRVRAFARNVSSNLKSKINSAIDRLLGLNMDLDTFYELAEKDTTLRDLAEKFRGVKPPRFLTVFESLINAFACQQVSLNVGILLLNRLAEGFGPYFKNEVSRERAYAFPSPNRLANLKVQQLQRLGFSAHKAEYIIETARQVTEGKLDVEGIVRMDEKEAEELLMQIRGVGRWTAEYALLRGAGKLQVFPADDVGGQNGLRNWLRLRQRIDYNQAKRIVSRWKPYAGIVYFHLLLNKVEHKGYLNEPNSKSFI